MARQTQLNMPPIFWGIVVLESILLIALVAYLPYKTTVNGKDKVTYELITGEHKGSIDNQILMMEVLGVFVLISAMQIPVLLKAQKAKRLQQDQANDGFTKL